MPSEWQEPLYDNNQAPQESYGNWTSTGDCFFDNITGSGQCDCDQRNGTVVTPAGPWISTGTCPIPLTPRPTDDPDFHIGGLEFQHPDGTSHTGQFCACTNKGEVLTPRVTYNSTIDSSPSYISQWNVVVDTSLSYVTSYEPSVNSSKSYPRTYTSRHDPTISYPTAWSHPHCINITSRDNVANCTEGTGFARCACGAWAPVLRFD